MHPHTRIAKLYITKGLRITKVCDRPKSKTWENVPTDPRSLARVADTYPGVPCIRGKMMTNREPLIPQDTYNRLRAMAPGHVEKVGRPKKKATIIHVEPIAESSDTVISVNVVEEQRQPKLPTDVCPKCGGPRFQRQYGGQGVSWHCFPCEAIRSKKSREDYPKRWILTRIKMNAKKRGIHCNLKEQDIPDFPEYCPVFPWIRLVYDVGNGRASGSVSIDRIDSTKGYIVGNIRIISDRANTLKGDASNEEMIALGKDAKSRKETNNV